MKSVFYAAISWNSCCSIAAAAASHMAVFHNLQLSRDLVYFMLYLMHFSSTSEALRDHQ